MPFETPNLIEKNTAVPRRVETDSFVIRPLRVTDARADFNAVTESRGRIKNTFGPDHPWPSESLTSRQNRIDVAWHRKEHQRRDSFTFTVYDHESETELGCLYIQPTRVDSYDATVYFWVSESGVQRDLSNRITSCIKRWISDDWPITKLIYPGRDICWDDWQTLKSE